MFLNLFQQYSNSNNDEKIGFEDILHILKHPQNQYLLISTLPTTMQQCLIQNTLSADREVSSLNEYINNHSFRIKIVVYGLHNTDPTVEKKYKQLIELGFSQVYMYLGGLFEWLLLQDIYGTNEFPTTTPCLDILKYRPKRKLEIPLLT